MTGRTDSVLRLWDNLGMSLPLVLTDGLLLDDELSHTKRALIGATLGHQRHSPSLSLLADALGVKEATILQAQRDLQAEQATLDVWVLPLPSETTYGYEGQTSAEAATTYKDGLNVDGWMREATGARLFSEAAQPVTLELEGQQRTAIAEPTPPLAAYDRPNTAHDRELDSPRFKRNNRLTSVAVRYDPTVPGNRHIELPAAIVDKLWQGKGVNNRPFVLLVTAYYAREQLRRGAIHVSDDVVAYELRYSYDDTSREARTRQVKRIRERLTKEGILVSHGDGVYTMPGATPGKPEDVTALDTAMSRRLHALHMDDEDWTILGTQAQYDEVARCVQQLGDEAAWKAVGDADLWPPLTEAADPIIKALREALDHKRGTSLPQERDIAATREGGVLPTTYYPPKSSSEPSEAETSQTGPPPPVRDEDRALREGGSEEPGYARPRRDYPSRCNTFVFANHAEAAELEAWHHALTNKYGQDEATGIWRGILVNAHPEHRGAAPGVLRIFRLKYGHLRDAPAAAPEITAPETLTEGEDYTLDSLPVFRELDEDESPS